MYLRDICKYLPGYVASHTSILLLEGRMKGCSVKEDVQGRGRDLTEVLSQHMPEGLKKPQRSPISQQRFEPRTYILMKVNKCSPVLYINVPLPRNSTKGETLQQ
jgi:hypothetical protein